MADIITKARVPLMPLSLGQLPQTCAQSVTLTDTLASQHFTAYAGAKLQHARGISRPSLAVHSDKAVHQDTQAHVYVGSVSIAQPSSRLAINTQSLALPPKPVPAARRRPLHPPPVLPNDRPILSGGAHAPSGALPLGAQRPAHPYFDWLERLSAASARDDFGAWSVDAAPHPTTPLGAEPPAMLEAWVTKELYGWQQRLIAEDERSIAPFADGRAPAADARMPIETNRSCLESQWHQLPKTLEEVMHRFELHNGPDLVHHLAPVLFASPSRRDGRMPLQRMAEAIAQAQGFCSPQLGGQHPVQICARKVEDKLSRKLLHTLVDTSSHALEHDATQALHHSLIAQLSFAYRHKRSETRAHIERALLKNFAEHRSDLGRDISDICAHLTKSEMTPALGHKLWAMLKVARNEHRRLETMLEQLQARLEALGRVRKRQLLSKGHLPEHGKIKRHIDNPIIPGESFELTRGSQLARVRELADGFERVLLQSVAELMESQSLLRAAIGELEPHAHAARAASLAAAAARISA